MTARRIVVTGQGSTTAAYAGIDWLALVATSIIWGASFLLIAEGLESLDPRVIAWTRLVLGAGVLVLFRRARRRIEPEDRVRIVVVGIASAGLPAILFAMAEETISSALAGMLVSATPIATVVIAIVLTRTWPRGPQRWGLAIGFLGVVLMALPNLLGTSSAPMGIAMVIIAVFSYGLGNNMYPPLQQKYGAMAVMMWAQTAAALLMTPLGLTGLSSSAWQLWPVLAVVILGVFGTGIARAIHVALVGRVGPARGAIAGYTIPVIALALGVLVRNETVEPIQVLAIGIAVGGAWLVSRREAGSAR
jgi:drug/metabolite transporter (DMT)-like permease